jgi:hypothetical protein
MLSVARRSWLAASLGSLAAATAWSSCMEHAWTAIWSASPGGVQRLL